MRIKIVESMVWFCCDFSEYLLQRNVTYLVQLLLVFKKLLRLLYLAMVLEFSYLNFALVWTDVKVFND